jgi:O-acetyl-ADP-ribose deacetylase (regulator of RNase III)
MMIKYVKGDILYTKMGTLAHGVSTDDDFKTGLGLTLRQAYPEMYKEFRQYIKSARPKSGEYWMWKNPAKQVLQLFIREESGKAKQSAVNRALHDLKRNHASLGIKGLALTRLGSGLGKLDWVEAKAAIEDQMASLPFDVHVYEDYVAGRKVE